MKYCGKTARKLKTIKDLRMISFIQYDELSYNWSENGISLVARFIGDNIRQFDTGIGNTKLSH